MLDFKNILLKNAFFVSVFPEPLRFLMIAEGKQFMEYFYQSAPSLIVNEIRILYLQLFITKYFYFRHHPSISSHSEPSTSLPSSEKVPDMAVFMSG